MNDLDKSKQISNIINQVRESYERCQKDDKFFDIFYRILLSKSNDIKDRFTNTDWIRQHNLIKLAIKSAILYAEQPEYSFAYKNIHDIAISHSKSEMNIKPELYPLWLDTLAESVQKCDPEYTDELIINWRKVISPTIDLIISKY